MYENKIDNAIIDIKTSQFFPGYEGNNSPSQKNKASISPYESVVTDHRKPEKT